MPESRDLPLIRWGEDLRRLQRARRSSQMRMAGSAAAAATVSAIICSLVWEPRPALVWNASASSPLGLYYVSRADRIHAGELALAWPPSAARELGARRRYLPRNVPLVKRVAAAAGDQVCAAGEAIYINGRLAARRSSRDPSGRPMPWWTGCESLSPGDLFLLSPAVPDAFDGRYFGISRHDHVLGRATLLWRG